MGSEPVQKTNKQVDSYKIKIIKTVPMFRTLDILESEVRRPQLTYYLHLVIRWFSSISKLNQHLLGDASARFMS